MQRSSQHLSADDRARHASLEATRAVNSGCIRRLSPSTQIVSGNVGDHPLVLKFLVQTTQARIDEDFQSRLDQPCYRPSDRLLLRQSGELAAHVQLCSRVGWYHAERIPLVTLVDFQALPEYHDGKYADALLQAAESTARQEGAAAAIVRTTRQQWFADRGWTRLRGQGYTRADPRAILAYFDAERSIQRRRRKPSVEIRSWRHFELDAIREIYDQTASRMWGPLQRSEAWWQWLVGRRTGEQILFAVDRAGSSANGPLAAATGWVAGGANGSKDARAVGYAVTRDSSLIEMFTLPGRDRVRSFLLARACRDAIDRGHHSISLLTAANDPLHEVIVTAGGEWIRTDAARHDVWMLKLLSPEKWIAKLYPVLHRRAQTSGVPRPLQLSIRTGETVSQFILTRRSARLSPVAHGNADLHCTWHEFQDLLASNLRQAAAALRVDAALRDRVNRLFPLELFWRSPFEWLRL